MAHPNLHEIDLQDGTITANGWKIDSVGLSDQLLEWGKANYQEFPWRGRTEPYDVLIAEVMLHRTRAAQVVPVYIEFIEKFPTINHVAEASLPELQESLRSLGLLWRVEKLYSLARQVVDEFDGRIPDNYSDLVSLPGVSHYIANAVLCFGWGKKAAIVDTNTLRITGRLFDLTLTDSSRRTKSIHILMGDLVDAGHPKEFNYSLLDLAHQICFPSIPLCAECPIRDVPCKFGTTPR